MESKSTDVAMMIKGTPPKIIIAVPPMIKAHEVRAKGRRVEITVLSVLRFMGFPTKETSFSSGSHSQRFSPSIVPLRKLQPTPRIRCAPGNCYTDASGKTCQRQEEVRS